MTDDTPHAEMLIRRSNREARAFVPRPTKPPAEPSAQTHVPPDSRLSHEGGPPQPLRTVKTDTPTAA